MHFLQQPAQTNEIPFNCETGFETEPWHSKKAEFGVKLGLKMMMMTMTSMLG